MKVVIALDSSAYARQVVEGVSKRSWPKTSEFKVLTGVEPSSDWDAQQEFLRQTEIILEERLAYLRKALPAYRVTGEVSVGTASKLINEVAREWKADLIVLGSHGDTGPRRSCIGSVAAAVVNDAPCSVELVKIRKLKQPALTGKLKANNRHH